MSDSSYSEHLAFPLGTFSQIEAIVSELQSKFPNRYSFDKGKEVKGVQMWLLSEENGEDTDTVMLVQEDHKALVIGQDSYDMIKRIFWQVLE